MALCGLVGRLVLAGLCLKDLENLDLTDLTAQGPEGGQLADIDGRRTAAPLIVSSTASVPGSTLVTLVEAIRPNGPNATAGHRTLMVVKIAVLGW